VTGYWKMLEDQNTIESQGRQENLEEFVNVMAEYTRFSEKPSLEEFLDQISLSSDLDGQDLSNDRLPLMTLHLAKGLEFPVVFLVGMEEGLFPHSRSLNSDEDIEEERRLCYVGMTRAKTKLYLSCVNERRLFGVNQYNFPSRFLKEIPEDVIERIDIHKVKDYFDSGKSYNEGHRGDDSDQSNVDYSYDQRVPDETESPYKRGMKVRHPVFGVGTIKSCESIKDGEKLTIAFTNGQLKQILSKYAQLVVL